MDSSADKKDQKDAKEVPKLQKLSMLPKNFSDWDVPEE